MSDFRKKQKGNPSKKLIIVVGGILIIIFSVLLVIANIKIYKKKQQLTAQVRALENKIEETKIRNEELKEGIEKANDIEYIEKVAREELDLQKPGEKVFSFVKAEEGGKNDKKASKNMFQNFSAWIGGWFK
ncbi:MAG: septum formation initiator family protein [bacterium]|nr:septum formation initiator family protein [bacterium]